MNLDLEITLDHKLNFLPREIKNHVFDIIETVVYEYEKENTELKADLETALKVNKQWLQRDTALEEQIEKMKCCENCGNQYTKNCSWDKRAIENVTINTCKSWILRKL